MSRPTLGPVRCRVLLPYLLILGLAAVIVASSLPGDGAAPGTRGDDHVVCESCQTVLEPATAKSMSRGGTVRYFCGPSCREALLANWTANGREERSPKGDRESAPRSLDVVCHMEVNPAWGISAIHDGKRYRFCTARCRELFVGDPARYLTTRCVVCREPLAVEREHSYVATYLGRSYELCSESHRAEFKADPAAFFLHTMWGIPPSVYYGSIAFVLVVSFGLFEWIQRHRRAPVELVGARRVGATVVAPAVSGRGGMRQAERLDLFGLGSVRRALRSRRFRFAVQSGVVALFLLVVLAGWFGNQNPALNLAPLLTWTIWWGLLPIFILFAGKFWCYVCPWDAIAGWTERLSLWEKRESGLSFGLKWPRLLRNISVATILFVGLTWVELGFGVTMNPRVTASLALAMVLLAVGSAMLFDRRSFCRHGCLVGRVSGLYALFSGIELRAREASTCASCRTKECVKGSDSAYGCPTFLYPGKLRENTYCIQCMECVQACPHDNLALNLRPWGSDLVGEGRPRRDETCLALLMLSITGFHGLTMTPVWREMVDGIRDGSGAGKVLGFSAGMALVLLAPIAVYALLVAVSRWLGAARATRPLGYGEYFVRYAYALLPIALFYHIAHNLEHLLMEGPKVVALLSDPFGWNWNLLGTAGWNVPPLISLENLWLVQALLVLIGHVYSLWVAQVTSLRLFGSRRAALRSQIPMLLGMILFSVFSLWLLKQPMEMRTSAM